MMQPTEENSEANLLPRKEVAAGLWFSKDHLTQLLYILYLSVDLIM
jgi:hypothetical protein